MPPRKKQASAPPPKKGGGAKPEADPKVAPAAAATKEVDAPPPPPPAAAAAKPAKPAKGSTSTTASDAKIGERCKDELAQITRVLFQDPAAAGTGKSRLKELDRTDFLETTLWPSYSSGSGFDATMLAILLINEKVAAQVDVFDGHSPLFKGPDRENTFAVFFDGVVQVADRLNAASTSGAGAGGAGEGEQQQMTALWYLEAYLVFLVNAYRAVENPAVRRCVLRYVSLPLWTSLSAARVGDELTRHPQLKRHWQLLQGQNQSQGQGNDGGAAAGKKRKAGAQSGDAGASSSNAAPSAEGAWVPGLVRLFLRLLDELASEPSIKQGSAPSAAAGQAVRCLERAAELLVDLLSQLATRRFLNALLDDLHVAVRCRRALALATAGTSASPAEPPLRLLGQLLALLVALMRFDVEDQSGAPLTAQDAEERLHARVHKLQTIAFARLQVPPI